MKILALALLVLALLWSGCSEPAEDVEEDPGIVVITNPYEQRLNNTADAPHLHDYWQGESEIAVMDAMHDVGQIQWFGDQIAVEEFEPDAGYVVPQGARWVNVTLTWEHHGDGQNQYQDPELWVKTAAQRNATYVAPAANDGTSITMEITNDDADLPHQILSGWLFELRMNGTQTGTPVLERQLLFSADVSLNVTAARGWEIPLYPGHPDRWDGQAQLQLLEATHTVLYDGDPTTGNWRCYSGCPILHTPINGTVVPHDADHVGVRLELQTGQPTRLGLKYRASDSRDFQVAQGVEESPNSWLFTIPVGSAGDGPYAQQSQWIFAPYPATPVENGYVNDTYTITAWVNKNPAS